MPTTTTTELVTFDGVVLNTYAYNVTTGTGRANIPATRGDQLQLPGRSGYIPAQNLAYEEGEFTLSMFVLGANTDDTRPATTNLKRRAYETNLATLMRIFSVRGRLCHVTAVQADGSTRESWAEVQEAIQISTMAGRTRGEFAVNCLIPDVYWRDTSPTTQATTASATLPKTLDLTSFTNMTGTIEDSVVTVTGPATNPRVTDVETGIYVQYNGSLTSAQSWVVDSGAYTSKVGATDVTLNTTHGGHVRYLIIPPYLAGQAYPRLSLSGAGGGSTTKLSVTAYRKYFYG